MEKKFNGLPIGIIILSILLSNCSSYSTFNPKGDEIVFEGSWYLHGNSQKTLKILKTDNSLYSLKFDSPNGKWQAFGYKSGNELLSVFEYQNKKISGYVTFKKTSRDELRYESFGSDGKFRSSGYYFRSSVIN